MLHSAHQPSTNGPPLQGFGLSSADIVRNFIAKTKKTSTTDQDVTPVAYANGFVTDDPAGIIRDAEKQLELARLIIATEIGKDPVVRQRIRTLFEGSAVISCLPTEKGNEKIDEFHPYMVCINTLWPAADFIMP